MVRTALNQHPELEFQSEILNGLVFGEHWNADTTLAKLMELNPNFCLHVWDPVDLEGMWPRWEMQEELQERFMREKFDAIRLTRRDKPAQAISYIEAEMTGMFHRFDEPADRQGTMHCPPWMVMDLIERFERADAFADQALPDAAIITYEDLNTMPDACFNRMQKILGVKPTVLRPTTKKLGTKPLHKRVRNWSQLWRALKETRYGHYLEGHVCS